MTMLELPRLHPDMFRPDFGGSRDTRERFAGLVSAVFGETGQDIFQGREAYNSSRTPGLDEHFLRAMQNIYGSSFRDVWKNAVGVVRYLGGLAGMTDTNMPVRDELSFVPNHPAQLFENLLLGDESTLGRQARRHLLLMVLSGQLDEVSGNGRADGVISDVISVLNSELYEGGLAGKNGRHHCYSAHGIRENDVNAVSLTDNFRGNIRVYEHQYLTREISGEGSVHTSPRTKDSSAAAVKAIANALHDGGEIMPETIEDFVGMKVTVLEDHAGCYGLGIEEERRSSVHRRYVEALANHWSTDSKLDNHVGISRGQNQPRWLRSVMDLSGLKIEIIVSTERGYYEQELHVGTRGEDGMYTGQAHDLYVLRRSMGVAQLILGGPDIADNAIKQSFITRSVQTADAIKNSPGVVRTSDVHRVYL